MHASISQPESWIDSGWWDVIGAVAGVLSLVAIVIAIAEVIDERRRVRRPMLTFDLTGTWREGDDSFHMGILRNSGSVSARLTTVVLNGGRFYVATADHLPRTVMGPGDSVPVLISSPAVGRAFLIVSHMTFEDRSRIGVSWLPVAGDGENAAAWEAAKQQSRFEKWWRRLANAPVPVGPGGYRTTSFRGSQKEGQVERLVALTSPPEPGDGPFALWMTRGVTGDLPFVPPTS